MWVVVVSTSAGPANGDAVVYLHQASQGIFAERTVHLAYIALAWLVHQAVPADPWIIMSTLHGCAGLGCVWWVARIGTLWRVPRGVSVWAAVLLLLPWAGWAEVDCFWLWFALIGAGTRREGWASASLAVACLFSPAGLLFLPWCVWIRRQRYPKQTVFRLLLTAAGAVGGAWLVVGCVGGLDWWVGQRGVLLGFGWAPGKTLGSWLLYGIPWMLLPLFFSNIFRSARWGVACALLGLLGPADTPLWLPLGFSCVWCCGPGEGRAFLGHWGAVLLLGLHGIWFGTVWIQGFNRVFYENQMVDDVAHGLSEGEGFVAPWSLGVRVSMKKSGDPYGWPWRGPKRIYPNGHEVWCGTPLIRWAILPPENPRSDTTPGNLKEYGIRWVEAADGMQKHGCQSASPDKERQ